MNIRTVTHWPYFWVAFLIASIFIGAGVIVGVFRIEKQRHARAADRSVTERQDAALAACRGGDKEGCVALYVSVAKPCHEKREPRACLLLGYLKEEAFGLEDPLDLYALAAAYYGVACAGGLAQGCELLHEHFEAPHRCCPWCDGLNPLIRPADCMSTPGCRDCPGPDCYQPHDGGASDAGQPLKSEPRDPPRERKTTGQGRDEMRSVLP